MNALLAECRRQGYRFTVRGETVKVKPSPPPELMAQLREIKDQIRAEIIGPPKVRSRATVNFRLPDHPPNAWATAVGVPGQTAEDLCAELRKRWPGVVLGDEAPCVGGSKA